MKNSLMAAMQTMIDKLGEIIGEVRTTADRISNVAEQVSATAQSLSQSSNNQATSVEETTSSMEQMGASIMQNTANAKVTDNMASNAARQAVEGGEAVGKTVAAMQSIADKIGIIDGIAYQTNLLALQRSDRSRARRRARQRLRRRRRRSPQARRTFAGRRAGDQQRRQGFGQARRARRFPAWRNGAVDQEDFRPRPGNRCVLTGTVLGRRPDQQGDGPAQPGDAAERFGIRGTCRDRRGNGRAGAATAGADGFLPTCRQRSPGGCAMTPFFMPIWLRLTVAIWLMLALALGGMIAWETRVNRETILAQAGDFANSIHEMTMAGLTGMMITGTVGQREVFLDQIKELSVIKDLVVIRSPRP
jgi:hypothetical protein